MAGMSPESGLPDYDPQNNLAQFNEKSATHFVVYNRKTQKMEYIPQDIKGIGSVIQKVFNPNYATVDVRKAAFKDLSQELGKIQKNVEQTQDVKQLSHLQKAAQKLNSIVKALSTKSGLFLNTIDIAPIRKSLRHIDSIVKSHLDLNAILKRNVAGTEEPDSILETRASIEGLTTYISDYIDLKKLAREHPESVSGFEIPEDKTFISEVSKLLENVYAKIPDECAQDRKKLMENPTDEKLREQVKMHIKELTLSLEQLRAACIPLKTLSKEIDNEVMRMLMQRDEDLAEKLKDVMNQVPANVQREKFIPLNMGKDMNKAQALRTAGKQQHVEVHQTQGFYNASRQILDELKYIREQKNLETNLECVEMRNYLEKGIRKNLSEDHANIELESNELAKPILSLGSTIDYYTMRCWMDALGSAVNKERILYQRSIGIPS